MSFTSQISRHHVMSPASQEIARKALAQLESERNADTLSTTASQTTGLQTGRIAFGSITDFKFKSEGFGLYSLSTDDPLLPTIWKKDVEIDPVTGKKTEWLVAYTTDDDDIVRATAANVGMAPTVAPTSAPAAASLPQGTRVFDRTKSFHGTLQNVFRPGVDKRAIILWDESGTSTFVTDFSALQVAGAQKTASVSPVLHAAAADGPKPPKNAAPIAPGILTKNLTLDQSGQGGTAKVTVDFNDPQKGEEFFKQVEELAGGVGGGEGEKPAEGGSAPEEAKMTAPEAPAEGEGAGGPPEGGSVPKPPTPVPAGTPVPMASTIKNLTHFGSKVVYLTMEKFASFPAVYFYVNESGERVNIALPVQPKAGMTIRRPDTGEKIRVAGLSVVDTKSDDDAILSNLLSVAVDISDQVPPMGWTNQDSQNEDDEAGGNKPLPPNPALQPGAGPTADTANAPPPVYDSANPAGGEKQKFNMSVNPNDNSVTVKFEKAPALDAIDQAVQGQQPPISASPVPTPAPSPAAAGAPLTGQPKQDFSQTEPPTQF